MEEDSAVFIKKEAVLITLKLPFIFKDDDHALEILKAKIQYKRLRALLEKTGFGIREYQDANAEKAFEESNYLRAHPVLTFVFFRMHGNADGDGAFLEKAGKEERGPFMREKELLDSVGAFPGKTVLALESCKIGGVVDYANNNREKYPNLMVLTASDKEEIRMGNPFVSKINDYLRTGCGGYMPEFFEKSFAKKIRGQEPRIFVGETMQKLRLR